jgi:arylsulfatase A-like enzyme
MEVPRSAPAIVLALAAASGCGRSSSATEPPVTIRLVDLFGNQTLHGTVVADAADLPKTEWRFDGPAPAAGPAPAEFAATRGVEGSPAVQGLAVRDGRLVGRTTTDFPLLRIARTKDLANPDQFHAIEVRLRASEGANLLVAFRGPDRLDMATVHRQLGGPGNLTTPIVAGPEMKTYTLTSPAPVNMARVRQVLIRPTDAAGATFEIESMRIVTRREHFASLPSGVGWQGLGEIYRESLVARSPEAMKFDLLVPERAWLDLAVGTIDDAPVTFRAAVAPEGSAGTERVLLDHTVTTPYRWERHRIELEPYAGRRVQLTLSLAGDTAGLPGLWGSPVVRSRIATTRETPQGVILIQADTLRPDHLGLYGHKRDTAPFLSRLAAEGAVFKNAFAQAGWTKVSTSSIMTSLYPSTHGVFSYDDRLPAASTTTAEVYRQAGYATLALSSVMFTGQYTNLHQGFEELHERTSAPEGGPYSSKTAREYVDRAAEWIERHRDEPFFLYLHVFDPHSPYEPRRPHDTLWADPTKREEHIRQRESLRKTIKAPFLAGRGMATRQEMIEAGVDPTAYIAYDKDWYDSSIRGLDVEIARLFARLRSAGLDEKTAVVFLSDHGEEFHEHGRMWHGQSTYGEMARVPLVVRWPGHLQAGLVVDEPVRLIDVMPTLLDISRLQHPEGIQGQSLIPLITADSAGTTSGTAAAASGWRRRPVIIEKQPSGKEHPESDESYAIVDGGWKLVRNTVRPPGKPEFELFDAAKDPLDQVNVADKHPDVVQRLAKALEGWHAMAAAARLKPDTEATGNMTPEQLQRLRSLGYIR